MHYKVSKFDDLKEIAPHDGNTAEVVGCGTFKAMRIPSFINQEPSPIPFIDMRTISRFTYPKQKKNWIK